MKGERKREIGEKEQKKEIERKETANKKVKILRKQGRNTKKRQTEINMVVSVV